MLSILRTDDAIGVGDVESSLRYLLAHAHLAAGRRVRLEPRGKGWWDLVDYRGVTVFTARSLGELEEVVDEALVMAAVDFRVAGAAREREETFGEEG